MNVLEVQNLSTHIRGRCLHDQLTFHLKKGEIMGLVGGSGCGKSVLLRVLLGLMPKSQGTFRFLNATGETMKDLRQIGVMFQSGALFSSLTVGENIQVPLKEIAGISYEVSHDLALLKLDLVGLSRDAFYKYPSELSGGMVKRAALARALALDSGILFLDEPTAGLDPISAESFDALLNTLQSDLGLSVLMVTHDLDTLHAVCDRVAVLVDHKIIIGTLEELHHHPHPWIQAYFEGPRGRALHKPLQTP